uniref:Uncharacterized protein LOC101242689 n=1 Tax=Phallusia mammillata TaxID=59560 RepID=A0A6F9DI10_9ASCI|nr:uncharacterized protein LOC101242689 [Phallusia mammillata]
MELYKPSGMSSVVGVGAMIFNLTSTAEAGEYMCIANNTVVNKVSVMYLAKPIIQNTRKSVTFNDGDHDRKLTCVSDGSYPTVTFQWSRREEGENQVAVIISPQSDPNINITTTGNNSTILFRNLTYSMQANYICEVNNVAGNATVEVRNKSNLCLY